MAALVGIDLGTSSVKALVWDADRRRVVGRGQAAYGYAVADGVRAEQDPELVWRRVVRAVRAALADAGRPPVGAVGASGQMHGLAPFDARGRVIGNIITWEDRRADVSVLSAMRRRAGALLRRSGCGLAPGFAAATLYALKQNRSRVWRRTRQWLLPGDWLRHRLAGGGAFVTDPSNASSVGLFDTERVRWNIPAIARLGLRAEAFPEVRPTCEVVERVGREASASCGLEAGTPLVTGGGDQPLTMIGSGLCRASDGLALNLGTGGQVARASATYRPGGGDTITFCFPGGGWSVLGATLSAGAAMRWWKGVTDDAAGGQGRSIAALARAAGRVPPGCDGLVFVPHLNGTRSDPDLRAGFHGLSGTHGLATMTRAVMEGVIFELYGLYRRLGGRGAGIVTIAGGGFTSPVWRRIAADVFAAPLRIPLEPEQAALGAALVAGVGIGCYADLPTACRSVRYRRVTVQPDPVAAAAYRDLRARRVRVLFGR